MEITAQPVAGPDANPLKRMNCPNAGDIRNDNGSCVAVESYLSTGSNKIYWVSQSGGNDRNPGTKSKPWKTISRSTRAGVLKPGDAVIIRGGTYREEIHPQEAGKSGKRITFSAYPGENVVVTGADPMNDGWTQSGNAWRHAWTTPLPAQPNVGTLDDRPEFRREMVIVDGHVLTPVYARADVVPGTFYVKGTDVKPEAIFMRLPGDDAPSGHFVEVGMRSALFLPKGAREDWCGGSNGWYRVLGITFRHAVNSAGWAAVCSGPSSLLEENVVEWTNGTGVWTNKADVVLRGNRANHNGMRGIGGRCNGCLITYNETTGNNWKEHAFGFGSSGLKYGYTTNSVFSHHLSTQNRGVGMWLDMSCEDNRIENSVISENTGRGILLEWGTKRTLVRNNVIFGTRLHPSEGTGIQSQAASHNIIIHNSIISNQGHGIWIRTDKRDDDGYNQIMNNIFINNGTGGGYIEMRIDGDNLKNARTNVLDGNLYWTHQGTSGHTFRFRTDDGAYYYRGNDIKKWRSLTASDANAAILDGSIQHLEDLGSVNGWRLVSGSAAIEGSVTLPSGIEAPKDIDGEERPARKADVGADQYGESPEVVPPVVVPSGDFVVETGSMAVDQGGSSQWHKVSLAKSFSSPVVLLSPVSYEGGHPSTVRVRNVSASSFEFQIDEWDYLDGAHTKETIHYVVVEAGRHSLGNGHELEAGLVSAGSDFSRVKFTQSFPAAPVVVSQIVTTSNGGAAVTRQQNVKADGFDLLIQSEEAKGPHGSEQVAYIAISSGQGSIDGATFSAGSTSRAVNSSFTSVDFGHSFSSGPVFLAAMQSMYGGDAATLRYRNQTSSGAEFIVEEEQSKDNETSHTTEEVGYIAIQSGILGTSSGAEVTLEAFEESGGMVVFEAENFDENISRSDNSWTIQTKSGNSGSSVHPGPVSMTKFDSGYNTSSPELKFRVKFTNPGTYYVWGRALASDGDSDSWHVGLDGQEVGSADRMTIGYGFNSWRWINRAMDPERASIYIPAPGVYVVNVWMREDGVFLDRLVLTTKAGYEPSGTGPPESSRTSVVLAKTTEANVATNVEVANAQSREDVPSEVELIGNYPNPFNPETTIQYSLPEALHVRLEVFDMLGRRVALLVDDVQSAGAHAARFNADGLASGIYLYRIKAGSFEKISRIILAK